MTQTNPPQDDREPGVDPDEANLPPGARLPDRALFIRMQHLARGVTSLVGLVFLIAFWAVFAREYPLLYAVCAGLISLSVIFHFYRYFRPA